MTQKLVILEVNEMPLRLFRHFQQSRPGSYIDQFMQSSLVLETKADDVDPSLLYPSQTWASLNTGTSHSAHKIYWYNDPKPDEYPLYWKTLASRGFTTGVVNSLHSSPAEAYAADNASYKFLIPDCFAPDSYTKPAYFKPFQKLTLGAVSSNARVVTMHAPIREAALTAIHSPQYGIRIRTMVDGAGLVYKILRKSVNTEQLRNLQFLLMADIFLKLFRQHQPDLAIMFTNHVAANMHRYWYALFPEDYQAEIYDNSWISKYSGEIKTAVDLLDSYLGEWMRLARETNRVLIVVSSMGQHANPKLTPEYRKARRFSFRLEDVPRFVRHITRNKYSFVVESAMVPQYTIAFPSVANAVACVSEIRESIQGIKGISVQVDQNGTAVTLSINPDPNASAYVIQDRTLQYSDLGFVRFEVEDHHSGCHCPEGSLIIYNSSKAKAASPSVNYLEYAPALMEHFSVARASYMRTPSFSF